MLPPYLQYLVTRRPGPLYKCLYAWLHAKVVARWLSNGIGCALGKARTTAPRIGANWSDHPDEQRQGVASGSWRPPCLWSRRIGPQRWPLGNVSVPWRLVCSIVQRREPDTGVTWDINGRRPAFRPGAVSFLKSAEILAWA